MRIILPQEKGSSSLLIFMSLINPNQLILSPTHEENGEYLSSTQDACPTL